MSFEICGLETLFDGARILDWTPERLLVLVQNGFLVEVQERRNTLVLRQPQMRLNMRMPGKMAAKDDSITLAGLPRAATSWAETSEKTLAQVDRILRAHVRLSFLYPELMWDAILRTYPTHAFETGAGVACQVHEGACWIDVHGSRPPDGRAFKIFHDALCRATQVVTLITDEGQWIPYAQANMGAIRPGHSRLFHAPRLSKSAHARLAHQAVLQGYFQELEQQILPLLYGL